jgi:hypothetical protein
MRLTTFGIGLALVATAGLAEPRLVELFTPRVDGKEISCATALQPSNKFDRDLRWWALGYWSGRNTSESARVGLHTDTNGVVAEIEKMCREQPSMLFIGAVSRTYAEMKKQGR